ncbi:hypothetical protein LEP1GSC060_1732 [Leptospira weilii serovar Ranarum str. ICFT]|uniref:Uncharacterized protein n=1 Tax=Leptospira weilii serovar Ranarum str. ICFT TaxID=1218598 RepID=N1WLK2_9LEPT|nr:hypothetical protein LEP1GSC060_1732 [Leptospira weilii serovar Ranarum str. ICFT]
MITHLIFFGREICQGPNSFLVPTFRKNKIFSEINSFPLLDCLPNERLERRVGQDSTHSELLISRSAGTHTKSWIVLDSDDLLCFSATKLPLKFPYF